MCPSRGKVVPMQWLSKVWKDQFPYVEDGPTTKHWNKVSMTFRVLAIIVGFGSLVLFIVGMVCV
jgi:hypothetical protein